MSGALPEQSSPRASPSWPGARNGLRLPFRRLNQCCKGVRKCPHLLATDTNNPTDESKKKGKSEKARGGGVWRREEVHQLRPVMDQFPKMLLLVTDHPACPYARPPPFCRCRSGHCPPGCPQAQGNQWASISIPLLNGGVGGERSYFQSDMNFLITFSITS